MENPLLKQNDFLFREDELLGVNKPAGVPVHGGRILTDQPETLLMMIRSHEGKVVHPAHRLDRPVSGVMILSGSKPMLAQLGREFENRQVRKCYLAVARGWTEPGGTISHPLYPARDDRKTNSVAREAVTRYQRIAQVEIPFPVHPYPASRYSLLALYPETGRRHQLRRHMKHISHHLIGDTTYGRGEHNLMFREKFDCHRLLLHAWSLEFRHPANHKRVRIQAPLDAEFRHVIDAFKWGEALDSWANEGSQ
jgi:tRNA pseudouridine65 synthase